jgi:hypothetical protein
MKAKQQVIILLLYLITSNLVTPILSEQSIDLDLKLDSIIKDHVENENDVSNAIMREKENKGDEITDSIKDLLESESSYTSNNDNNNNFVSNNSIDSINNKNAENANLNIDTNNISINLLSKFENYPIQNFRFKQIIQLNNQNNTINPLYNNNTNQNISQIISNNISNSTNLSLIANNQKITKSNNNEIKNLKEKRNTSTTEFESNRIRKLFEKKIKKINSKNYFSKSVLNNDTTIFKHVYLGNNSPLEKTWKYDVEREVFIVPSEVQNEDDWNKFLRILSLLDSMNFENFSEKDQRKSIYITNPPIVLTGELVNNGDVKHINSISSMSGKESHEKYKKEGDDSMSFLSIGVTKKRRNRHEDNKIINPPNFLMDI